MRGTLRAGRRQRGITLLGLLLWAIIIGFVALLGTTDKQGRFSFRSIKPAGYPIPINGPCGDLLKAQGRHNMRPAHLHFLIFKPGYKTHISQVYLPDDPNIETDVQFGVTRRLLGEFVRHA